MTAARARFAFAGETDARAAFDTGGNIDGQSAFLPHFALPAAFLARILNDAAAAVAGWAGAFDGEKALLGTDAADAAAGDAFGW